MATRVRSLLEQELSTYWKTGHVPRSKRVFHCDCGRQVFFINSQCLGCDAPLGYEPTLAELRALQPGEAPNTWRLTGEGASQGDFRRCDNFETPARCNWLVPADGGSPLCLACRLNRTLPDLSQPENREYWCEIERAKRQLVSQLLALGLPVQSRTENPEQGVAFDLLRPSAEGPRLLTGHANGVITLNVEEADDAKREKVRNALREPYRTLLGHFRHEIGHYYWDRLVRDTPWLEPFRALFGDERADYAAALKENYENGPPTDWADRYISAYASTHPWEDWAETWAHFLHITDSLSTAAAYGLHAEDIEADIEPFTRADLYDPEHPDAERSLFLINSWVEMATVLNDLGRTMGLPDFYPFVMSGPVVKKLHFIGLVVRDAWRI